jgi:hypothetical protein
VRSHIDPGIPLVAVCNISETFYDFLSRAAEDDRREILIRGEQYRGDRTLVWLGDPKLVIVSFPIPHGDEMCQRYGYPHTRHLAPSEPSAWLSLDIMREQRLMEAIVEYAGPGRTVQLVPYASTEQFLKLAEALEKACGLTVLLPETPSREAMWVRDYVDTKIGFRILSPAWLPNPAEMLPFGMVCQTAELAASSANWYCSTGRACIVKADIGENGIGNSIVRPGDYTSVEALAERLKQTSFLHGDWVTVEELIDGKNVLSPSLEIFVPPTGSGDPYITYVSDQVFQGFGDFCGVLVGRELNESKWYPPLAESGLAVARGMQAMGYVGHFDLDCVVDDNQRVYLLEVNSRRTGGTHVHEFGEHFFGADYLDQVTLLSHDTMRSGPIETWEHLKSVIGNLAYPMNGQKRGVIVTITSALADREYGCIFVGANKTDTLELQRQVNERIAQVG